MIRSSVAFRSPWIIRQTHSVVATTRVEPLSDASAASSGATVSGTRTVRPIWVPLPAASDTDPSRTMLLPGVCVDGTSTVNT